MKVKQFLISFLLVFMIFQDSIIDFTKINILSYVDELIVTILILLALFNIFSKKKINTITAKLLISTIIFSIIGISSCYINSKFILSRVIISNFLVIKFWLLIIAIINLNISEDIRKCILKCIKVIGSICGFFAIFNFLLPNIYISIFTFVPAGTRFGLNVVSALFNHPGKYGWFMLLVALIYLSEYHSQKEKKKLKYFLLFSLFAILSFRTKVLIALVVIGVYILKDLLKSKKNFTYVVIIFVVLCMFAFIFREYIFNTYTLYFTAEKGYSARQALLDNSIEIIKDYFPLGVGFGQYGSWYARLYYSEYYYKYDMNTIWGLYPSSPEFATDTFWPAILGETGIIGVIVYMYMIYCIYNFINNQYNKDKKNTYLFLAKFAIIQTICESFGEPSLNSAPQNIVVAVIVGIAINSLKEKNKNE